MIIGTNGNRRKMGDANNLGMESQITQVGGESECHLSSDAGIYLIKDERPHLIALGEYRLYGEHHSGHLSAGSNLRERTNRFPRVG